MKIIQIVPKLPPSFNGVGDYALNLARQLRQDFEIETHFIVGDPYWQGGEMIEGFAVSQLAERSSKALTSLILQLSIDKVVLHYAGYGYAPRGCPLWLVDGLKLWRKQQIKRKLFTMFHELYATSKKPWTSSFWLSPFQKKLTACLTQISVFLQANKTMQILFLA